MQCSLPKTGHRKLRPFQTGAVFCIAYKAHPLPQLLSELRLTAVSDSSPPDAAAAAAAPVAAGAEAASDPLLRPGNALLPDAGGCAADLERVCRGESSMVMSTNVLALFALTPAPSLASCAAQSQRTSFLHIE